MPTVEFLQLIVVAAIAGYVGYLLGRASVKPDTDQRSAPANPRPEPEENAGLQPRRTGVPPSASAGGDAPSPAQRTPPRRSSAPPPAAAGLMKRDD